MSDTPIHSFFMGMSSFHPNDIAVLLGFVAMQELSVDSPITPGAERRLWSVELEPHELKDTIGRLESAGEIERILVPGTDESGGEMVTAGFRVVRFFDLQDLMTDFGRRRYNRIKQDKHRKSVKTEAVA